LSALSRWIERGKRQRITCRHTRYPKEIEKTQSFYLVRNWYSFEWTRRLIHCEEVPSWAIISLATTGFTDWKSTAPQWMHEAAAKEGWDRGWNKLPV
jgi:hypothetical protein